VGTTVLAVLAFVVGALVVVTTLLSAIMTLVVPRAIPVLITRWVFSTLRGLFELRGRRARSFQARDRDMALYGPISLFSLAATWLVLTGVGYMLLFWSLGVRPLREALELSGSSIYTLGFAVPPNLPTTVLAFSEAGIGLVLLAMLISYLPSMYQSFSRREAAVAALDVRADTPPTAAAMLIRVSRIEGWDRLNDLWRCWTRLPCWLRRWTGHAAPTPSCASEPAMSPWGGSPTSSASSTTPTHIGPTRRSRSTGASSIRSAGSWPRLACPSRPTSSRRGGTSPAGG
jgi:hypothetical protein